MLVEPLEPRTLLHTSGGGFEEGYHSTLEELATAGARRGAPVATMQDFDGPGTPFSIDVFGQPGGPVVTAGGPTGNFMRMVNSTTGGELNVIAFDRTATGLYTHIVAEFDFRMTPGGNGRADGIGFALLNTANYGNTGAVFGYEEANFTGSLGVGFDIYANGENADISNDEVTVHFNGEVVARIDATPIVDLASGEWIHAQVDVRLDTNPDVSVTLTPAGGQPRTVVDGLAISGLSPYESRVFFSGRTGGETADHDLDNILVQYSGSPDPAVYGQWSDVMDWEIIAIHAHLLPTGQVLAWERLGQTRLWDPATGTLSTPSQPGFDSFCTGHAFLPDGRLLVLGGHIQDGVGLPNSATYDPDRNEWNAGPNMNAGRWYPTSTTLADGNVVVVSGSIDGTLGVNSIPQVWQTATSTWRTLADADRVLPLYPFMHVAPDGRVFNSGPNTDTAYLDTTGTGTWTPVADRPSGLFRDYGSSVMYEPGKVLVIGGGPPTATTEMIDLNSGAPSWQAGPAMAYARRQLNTTILPDGSILATGGTSAPGFNNATGQVQIAELWNPQTNSWSILDGAGEARLYHSTALLLPDGRILSAGGGAPAGGGNDADHLNAEIFSPPYLFKGPRPTITAAPDLVRYGEAFSVQTPDAPNIARVNWVRLSSVTHAFNQNQRFNRLNFTTTATGLNVTAPADPNLAPPGHYMLFILDDNGVPSVAKIIQVVAAPLKVQDAQLLLNRQGKLRGAIITFSTDLDRARAVNRSNYELRLAGSDGQFNTLDDKILKIQSRQLNGSNTVTLSLKKATLFRQTLRLTIIGTPTAAAPAIADSLGTLLDGDGDGAPGGNFVQITRPPM